MNQIVSLLQNILNTYQSMEAFFYQKIMQTQYTNNSLSTYQINYLLLLPSSQFITLLNEAQVNAQLQYYVNLCDQCVVYITTTLGLQSNLIYEKIQGQLDYSIAQISGFASSLLTAQYNQLFTYTIPYTMSMTTAMYQNNLNLDNWLTQIRLNPTITDFHSLRPGTQITFSR